MSGRSTSNESSSTSLQSPRNKKSKPPTSASSSSSSSSSHTVPIIYNYQNYPQSEAEKEEKKVVGGYDLHLKLLMLGDSGVGKSSLVLQYANEEFTTNFVTTIGIDYKIKLLESGKHKVKLQIWDTAGQERFRTITTSYFKGADGIMLVYDMTDRESFENIVVWARDIRNHADPHVGIILVANKKDLSSQREISYDEGLQMARRMNVHFYEVSAKNGENVTKAYESIADTIKENMLHPEGIKKRPKLDNIVLNDPSVKKSKNHDMTSRSAHDSNNSAAHSKGNCC